MKPDPIIAESGIVRSLGVCIGASTVSTVQIEQSLSPSTGSGNRGPDKPRILSSSLHPHEGNPKQTLADAVGGLDLDGFHRIAVTGRRLREHVNLTSLSEPEAVEYAYRYTKPKNVDCPAIVSAGGETFMAYVLDRKGRISNVLTGNKCASGTGEFFLQQLRRMDVSLETASCWAAEEEPYPVSGRCSVFCKSDCTHATNKGIPKPNVTAGLCRMMAGKALELLKKVDRRHIMITGGTARNRMMIEYLKEEIDNLIVPEAAPYFEALGAALWALDHDTVPAPSVSELFRTESHRFDTLPPLRDAEDLVEFKEMTAGEVCAGDTCVLGLDVGSTTTKAVLVRLDDDAMLASVYLRTNGDPVGAARKCYQAILEQIRSSVDPKTVDIIGLGICGSGRQIAGLHALTDNVINEIIAHAAAAVYFDPAVDTIFEIGGQDAKYTYITNGVPSDYAMNEACSAGTGSFLEESALESLGVEMEEIGDIALEGRNPPNFNDQCAAFISSDIKNAIHEGVVREDIVAALVYSICMNYSNRVKGNRPVGGKIYMQGGVCYNPAVPLAMASLIGKPIVVPPEPGLMGAYGVGLEVKKRLDLGLTRKQSFDLVSLAEREVEYGTAFTCKGGKEKCDRRCKISRIAVEGKTYPFGGACNRYYNLRNRVRLGTETFDFVRIRQKLIYDTYAAHQPAGSVCLGRVGINRSFMTHTYYPLYSTFFSELGFEPVLSEACSQKGIDRRNAAFCYPGELSHGFFQTLLEETDPLDYLFLPHFRAVDVPDDVGRSVVCPLLQGEPFYLQAAFRREIDALRDGGSRILTPLIDLTEGLTASRRALVETARQMNVSRSKAELAFEKAVEKQSACRREMKSIGEEILRNIEAESGKTAVVLFARSYNGFAEEAHMGIPNKIASRGITVIPYDFLSSDGESIDIRMYWGMGRMMLKAAEKVKKHPQLFGTYITNFSCGPDSFILGYFRDLMGRKPSLTLELDSHTADAGLETRVEAFLDIVSAYRQLISQRLLDDARARFVPARIEQRNGIPTYISSSGEEMPLTDRRVTSLFPSMGETFTQAVASVFRGKGFHTHVHPPADEAVLKLGRANSSCKECLPLQLTTGTLLDYYYNNKKENEALVYFYATGSGPCRFGQYAVFMQNIIRKLRLKDVVLLSVSSDDAYTGLGNDVIKRGFWAIVIADVMEDIRSMLLANAVDTEEAVRQFEKEWGRILTMLEDSDLSPIEEQLRECSQHLSRIPMKLPIDKVPKILLTGEIFVRRDPISRQYMTEQLAGKGFATVCSPISEWLSYCDYVIDKGLDGRNLGTRQKLRQKLKRHTFKRYERRIKAALARPDLIHPEVVDVDGIVGHASGFMSPELTGEAVLTIGSAMSEVVNHTCGAIAIGPFGCMPNRLSESILSEIMTSKTKTGKQPGDSALKAVLEDVDHLPFLAIESDGSPFPQLIHAKLEAFCLNARRLHHRMMSSPRLGRQHQGQVFHSLRLRSFQPGRP